jgi:hypothetical protein
VSLCSLSALCELLSCFSAKAEYRRAALPQPAPLP